MIFYLTTILVSMFLIALFNILFGTPIFNYSIGFVILMVICTTLFQILIDGLFAFIINKLPKKWFGVNNKYFNYSKKRQRFYEKLKVKKWKDKVLELGVLGGFRKNKINEPKNKEYIEKFIIECNKGILVHQIGCFVGFLGIFLFDLKYALVIGIPIAIVNLFLNVLPIIILQYNQPKLKVIYNKMVSIS